MVPYWGMVVNPRFLVASLCFSSGAWCLASPPQYSVHLIGNLGDTLFPDDINSSGLITGRATTTKPFVFSPDTGYSVLNTPPNGGDRLYRMSVNSSGTLCGSMQQGDFGYGFVWTQSAGYTSLGSKTWVNDISDDGQMCGAQWVGGSQFPTTWSDATHKSLLSVPSGTLDGVATSRNNLGQTVGFYENGNEAWTALWSPQGVRMELQGVSSSEPRINNNGLVSGVDSGGHAYYWTLAQGATVVSPLSGFQSQWFFGSNDMDMIVGYSDKGGVSRATLFAASFGNVDINSLVDSTGDGWVLETASAINASGTIIGRGKYNGQTAAFYATVVPEPAPGALFGAMTFLVLRSRKHRRAG